MPGTRSRSKAGAAGVSNLLSSPDAIYFYLPFQLMAVCQGDMGQDNPIACHRKGERSLIAPGLYFLCLAEAWAHAGVRHVRLQQDVSTGHCFAQGAGQSHSHYGGAYPRRPRRNFMLNDECRKRFGRATTGRSEQDAQTREHSRPGGLNQKARASAARGRQAQVHTARSVSSAGGNIW